MAIVVKAPDPGSWGFESVLAKGLGEAASGRGAASFCGWAVGLEVGEEVSQVLVAQTLEEAVGHDREGHRAFVLDVALGDDGFLLGGVDDRDRVGVALLDEAYEGLVVRRVDAEVGE